MKQHRQPQFRCPAVNGNARRIIQRHLLKIRMDLEPPDTECLCPLQLFDCAVHARKDRAEGNRTRNIFYRLRQKIVDAVHLMRRRCRIAHDKARDASLLLIKRHLLRRCRVAGDLHAAVKRADGRGRLVGKLLREDMRVNICYLSHLRLPVLSGTGICSVPHFRCNIIPRNRTRYKQETIQIPRHSPRKTGKNPRMQSIRGLPLSGLYRIFLPETNLAAMFRSSAR